MTYELMQREFPDFDQSTLPAISANWEDISWHNDTCPSFSASPEVRVYIDYADKALREWEDSRRFGIVCDGDGSMIETDDWDKALTYITKFTKGA